MTGTDLEVEMVASINVAADLPGSLTVPARKLVDIIRELPEQAEINFTQKASDLRSGLVGLSQICRLYRRLIFPLWNLTH